MSCVILRILTNFNQESLWDWIWFKVCKFLINCASNFINLELKHTPNKSSNTQHFQTSKTVEIDFFTSISKVTSGCMCTHFMPRSFLLNFRHICREIFLFFARQQTCIYFIEICDAHLFMPAFPPSYRSSASRRYNSSSSATRTRTFFALVATCKVFLFSKALKSLQKSHCLLHTGGRSPKWEAKNAWRHLMMKFEARWRQTGAEEMNFTKKVEEELTSYSHNTGPWLRNLSTRFPPASFLGRPSLWTLHVSDLPSTLLSQFWRSTLCCTTAFHRCQRVAFDERISWMRGVLPSELLTCA